MIEQIQRKADGSYLVQCNGYPYHATQQQTPEIYEKVLLLIEQGEPVSEFIAPVPEVPDPQEAANQEYSRLRAVADLDGRQTPPSRPPYPALPTHAPPDECVRV